MDATTKERYFTTPMSIAATSGIPAEMQYSNNKRPYAAIGSGGGKGGGKGQGSPKGKGGKGGGKGGKPWQPFAAKGKGKGMDQCASVTPEGLRICFSYNNSAVRCRKGGKGCSFAHVCGRCFQKHPIYQCRGNGGRSPETQGTGTPTA